MKSKFFEKKQSVGLHQLLSEVSSKFFSPFFNQNVLYFKGGIFFKIGIFSNFITLTTHTHTHQIIFSFCSLFQRWQIVQNRNFFKFYYFHSRTHTFYIKIEGGGWALKLTFQKGSNWRTLWEAKF